VSGLNCMASGMLCGGAFFHTAWRVRFRCRQTIQNSFTFKACAKTIIARTDDPYNYTPFRTPKRAPAAHSRRRLRDCGHRWRRHRLWHPAHARISCSPIGKPPTHHCHLVSRRDLCFLLHSLSHRTWDYASARGWMVCVFSPCIWRVRWILSGLHRLDRASRSGRLSGSCVC
jgi:hypothetical protein